MTERRIGPGDMLARKYRVEQVLGSGNMGIVVAAIHVDLHQRVAIKQMLPDKDDSAETRERFLREARAVAQLKSHHVARVFDVGTDEDNAPYIVMEYLKGRDLREALKDDGAMPFGQAVEYILQACEAIGEAHAAGIIHRDLKPANLFLTTDVGGAPCIKVVDFGVSKNIAELSLTRDEDILGSPLYMSPEAIYSSKTVDARSDIWSLGIILYQLVAGFKRSPFHAPTVPELFRRVLQESPMPLAEYRPDAPAGFEAVILRCLERDKEKRFQHVGQLAEALVPYAPTRARIYAERVARAVGAQPTSIMGVAPSLAHLKDTIPLDPQQRLPLPSAPAAMATTAAIASPASTMTPEAMATTVATASAGSTSNPALAATFPLKPPAPKSDKPRSKASLIALGVAIVAAPALILGVYSLGNSNPAQSLSPTAVVSTSNATTPSAPAAPSASMAPVIAALVSATAAPDASASAAPAVSSAPAAVAPVVPRVSRQPASTATTAPTSLYDKR